MYLYCIHCVSRLRSDTLGVTVSYMCISYCIVYVSELYLHTNPIRAIHCIPKCIYVVSDMYQQCIVICITTSFRSPTIIPIHVKTTSKHRGYTLDTCPIHLDTSIIYCIRHRYICRQLKSVEAWECREERPTSMPKVRAKEDHVASRHRHIPI